MRLTRGAPDGGLDFRDGGQISRVRVLRGDLFGFRTRGDRPLIGAAGKLPKLLSHGTPKRNIHLFFCELCEVPDGFNPGIGEFRTGDRANTPQLIDGKGVENVFLAAARNDEDTIRFGQARSNLCVLFTGSRPDRAR